MVKFSNGGVFDSAPEKKAKGEDEESDEDDDYLALFWSSLERQRDVYRRSLEERLDEYFRMVAARIHQGVEASQAFHEYLPLLTRILQTMWQNVALAAYNRQRQAFMEDLTGGALLEYMTRRLDTGMVADYARQRAEQLTSTSIRVFNKAASQNPNIHDLIQEQFMNRIEVIANREVVGAQSFGFDQAASEIPEDWTLTKTWVTQRDNRVRDSHVDLEGVKIPVDEIFSNGCYYPGDPDGPPDEVINCRCGLIYSLTRVTDES